MNEPERIDDELLHRELDGETTRSESLRLREALRRDPGAQARFEGLARLFQVLLPTGAAGPAVDAPDLRAEVMQAVRAKAAPATARAGPGLGAFAAMAAAFSRRPALGLSFAFAAGLLLAAVGLGLREPGFGRPVDQTAISGAMLPGSGARDERSAGLEVDRALLQGDGLRAQVVVAAEGDLAVVRVQVESPGPLSLGLAWAAADLSPLGFARSGPAERVELRTQGLEVEGAGPGHYEVRLAVTATTPLATVRLRRAGGAFSEVQVRARP